MSLSQFLDWHGEQPMTVIAMSHAEIDRMGSELLRRYGGDRSVSEAATSWGLDTARCFAGEGVQTRSGPQALVSCRRGKPSNRCYPTALRAEVIGIIRERYSDFGPTLAAEKLAELHGIRPGARDGSAMDDRGGSVEGSPAPG